MVGPLSQLDTAEIHFTLGVRSAGMFACQLHVSCTARRYQRSVPCSPTSMGTGWAPRSWKCQCLKACPHIMTLKLRIHNRCLPCDVCCDFCFRFGVCGFCSFFGPPTVLGMQQCNCFAGRNITGIPFIEIIV